MILTWKAKNQELSKFCVITSNGLLISQLNDYSTLLNANLNIISFIMLYRAQIACVVASCNKNNSLTIGSTVQHSEIDS